jgi:hypothetical protein
VQLVRRLQLSGVQAFPTNLRSTRRLQMPGSLFRGLFTRGIRLTHPIWWGAVGFCSTGRTSEGEEVKRRRRRSRQEVQRLVTEFRTSGLRPSKFCRIHGRRMGRCSKGSGIELGSQGGSQKVET